MLSEIEEFLCFLKDTDEKEIVFFEEWLQKKDNSTYTSSDNKVNHNAENNQRNQLIALYKETMRCHMCSLVNTRNKMIFGAGKHNSKLMIIGDIPEIEDEKTGYPFQGESGQLLDNMLKAIQLDRKNLFIANVLKCCTPQNREPQSDEIIACLPYINKQIDIIKPELFFCLGHSTAKFLLQTNSAMEDLRQKIIPFHGGKMIISHHPRSLIKNPLLKREAWDDLKLLKKLIDTE